MRNIEELRTLLQDRTDAQNPLIALRILRRRNAKTREMLSEDITAAKRAHNLYSYWEVWFGEHAGRKIKTLDRDTLIAVCEEACSCDQLPDSRKKRLMGLRSRFVLLRKCLDAHSLPHERIILNTKPCYMLTYYDIPIALIEERTVEEGRNTFRYYSDEVLLHVWRNHTIVTNKGETYAVTYPFYRKMPDRREKISALSVFCNYWAKKLNLHRYANLQIAFDICELETEMETRPYLKSFDRLCKVSLTKSNQSNKQGI